jgi:putative transposase
MDGSLVADTDVASADTIKLLVSHTGHVLSRNRAFRFAADLTVAQSSEFLMCAGARRYMFNHHIGRMKENLDTRRAEAAAGVDREAMTASLSWSKVSLINECNAWKNGQLDTSPINDDGTRGLAWRHEVPADVFECASVDAAHALANFSNSVKGVRKGKKAGFAKFKSKHHSTPSFRLRSKSKPGASSPVRVTGPHSLRLAKLGEVRVHGCTRELRRMMTAGRFHVHSVTVKFEQGKWWISVEGVAAVFHHQRRSPQQRHRKPAGVDRGVRDLVVIADIDGDVLHVVKAVRSLQNAQLQLKRANQALSRTKTGSNGRTKARARLTRVHARIKWLRQDAIHKASHWAATTLTRLTIEDLNIAGMVQFRSLAKSVSDAAMGQLGRQVAYKADWYGLELVEADRWFPSTKTCSECSNVKAEMSLSEHVYNCHACGARLNRDVNAAINLARWPDRNKNLLLLAVAV